MKKHYNEFVIGISVTIAILIVITGIMWLEKSNIFSHGFTLHIIVQDAKGISVGDEVLYKGLAVGTVQKARITPQGISITVKMQKGLHIPADSKFEIKEISLLGEKAVVILPGQAHTFLKSGQIIKGEPENGLMALAESGKQLSLNMNRILSHLDSLSGPENMKALSESIRQLHELLVRSNTLLANSAPHLQGTLQNLHEMTSKNKEAVDSLLQAFGSKSTRLKETLLSLNRISKRTDSLLLRLAQGQGTMGQLLINDSLYHNLNRTILHLDCLIVNIKKNPRQFFEVKVF